MKKLNRLNNFLYYLIVLVFLGGLTYFFHSYFMAVAVIVFLLLPALSYLFFRISFKAVSIGMSENETQCKRGEPYKLKINVKNKCFVPILNINFKIRLKNDFSDEAQERYVNTSVAAFANSVVEFELKPTLCGRVNAEIENVRINDFFLFFERDISAGARFVFDVLPRRIKYEDVLMMSENLSDDSEEAKKDSAGNEVVNIREYVAGDSLKTVHWKLSAKKDELYVREKGDTVQDRPILVFELCKNGINHILDLVYAVARQYVKQAQPIKICWAGSESEQLSYCTVYAEEDIYAMFERVYNSIASNDGIHSLSVARRQMSGGAVMYISSDSADSEKGVVTVDL
jgi:hypothetical protein